MSIRNVVMATPVYGEASSLRPAVNPSIMRTKSIEEEIRLTVSFNSMLVYFRHHQPAGLARLRRRNDFFEDMSVKHPMVL